MKAIQRYIFEASGKPSDLKKYKRTERKETVHYISGDVYDFSDPGYDDEFKYYDASGNGYIKDKEGHVYDVVTSITQGDAGRIAGGSTSYYVCIKKANGKDNFIVTGYSAIFSRGSNENCVYDLQAGYYLEDYIAKYWNKWDDKEGKFKEIAEKGDKDAKPYVKQKEEREKQKKEEFNNRYINLPRYGIKFHVTENGLELDWHPGTSDELDQTKNKRSNTEYQIKDENGKWIRNPEYNKLEKEIQELQRKADDLLLIKLKEIFINQIFEIFKTKNIDSLRGIGGNFVVPYEVYRKIGKNGDKRSYVTLAIDTKTKNIVTVAPEVSKVLDDDIELKIADTIYINKDKMSPQMEKLFSEVAKAWKKEYGRTQGKFVDDNWKEIKQKSGDYYWDRISDTEAKKRAKEKFAKLVRDHDWEQNTKIEFSLDLIRLYVEGDINDNEGPVEKPLQDPTPSKERGKNTKMSKGAQSAAYDKMKAWHEGTRKQNLSNCSDAKLKMNYRVCKELRYDKEMDLIQQEADKRNLTLESLSLQEMVNILENKL